MLKKLAQLANEGLKKMYLSEKGIFCHRLLGSKLQKEGENPFYTLMAIIGLAKAREKGLKSSFVPEDLFQNVLNNFATTDYLGFWSYALWAASVLENENINSIIIQCEKLFKNLINKKKPIPSMETAYLLYAICEYLTKQKDQNVMMFAKEVFQALIKTFHETSGLFSFTTRISRKNIVMMRINQNLGSFASQINSIMALSKYYQISHNKIALEKARKCANVICTFQGELGQWWWIYNVKKGFVVEEYPIYSIHQDGVAIVSFLELQKSLGESLYEKNLKKGLQWLEGQNELKIKMYDEKNKIIWRAIQRKENPSSQKTGPWGLGKKSYFKMQLAGLLNSSIVKKFPLPDKYELLLESRPYHNGWVLLAWSMSHKLKNY